VQTRWTYLNRHYNLLTEVEAILLDTSLEGLNGWEILSHLRQLEPELHTPIVLLSFESDRTTAGSSNEAPSTSQRESRTAVTEDAVLSALTKAICAQGEKGRVLIVESDPALAESISKIFARVNLTVRLAHTLDNAIDSCFTYRPHLLILNIGMPDGDGFNVVDWLRQHESLARLPVAAYTSRAIGEAELEDLTLGPTYFLSKAKVQPKQLEALVLTMLRNPSPAEETTQQA